jgi:hypothetical protein
MLKVIHASEDLAAAREKTNRVKLPGVAEVARRHVVQLFPPTRRYGCLSGTIAPSLHRAVFLFRSDAVEREATFFDVKQQLTTSLLDNCKYTSKKRKLGGRRVRAEKCSISGSAAR